MTSSDYSIGKDLGTLSMIKPTSKLVNSTKLSSVLPEEDQDQDTGWKTMCITTETGNHSFETGRISISEISSNLSETSIRTPKRSMKCSNGSSGLSSKEQDKSKNLEDLTRRQTASECNNTKIPEKEEGLISTSFTLNSGGNNVAVKRNKSRALSALRRSNFSPTTLNYLEIEDVTHTNSEGVDPELLNREIERCRGRLQSNNSSCNTTPLSCGSRHLSGSPFEKRISAYSSNNNEGLSPNMLVDEMSFYDNQESGGNNSNSSEYEQLDDTLLEECTLSPSGNGGLLSPEGSPQRFTVLQNTVMVMEEKRSFNDGGNSSSVDSGYEAMIPSSTSSLSPPKLKIAEPLLKPPSFSLNLDNNKINCNNIHSENRNVELPPRINIEHHHYRREETSVEQKFIKQSLFNKMKISDNHNIINIKNNKSKTPPKSLRILHSLSSDSTESSIDDEDSMGLFEMESLDDYERNLPSDINSLISGHIKAIKNTPESKRRPPAVRRCLSLVESCSPDSNNLRDINNIINDYNNSMTNKQQSKCALNEPKNTPEILKTVQQNVTPFASRHYEKCFKRPDPPSISPIHYSKRYKTENNDEKENDEMRPKTACALNSCNNANSNILIPTTNRPVLRKTMSLNEEIMSALARSSSEPDLIGDLSKPFCLPLIDGRHRDLKSISCETMAKLIRGGFHDCVASFKIIDCRYPYEYDGGHIQGAQNLYTHEQIVEELVNCKTEAPIVQEDEPKRHILVFHCEFSSERGPKLSRFLRRHDRLINSNKYPALHYPEVYLLHGGYKDFFERFSELCDPIAYCPMSHPSFCADYKQCRAKSKSWNGDMKTAGTTNRLTKSRSRLVL